MKNSIGRFKLSSFRYAFNGVITGLRDETNFRIMFVCFVLVLVVNTILGVSAIHWIVTLICCALCLSMELINSGIERSIDLIVGDQIQEYAKQAKDLAAGASMIAAIVSAIVACIVYIPYIIGLF